MQHTVKRPITCTDLGLHSGMPVHMRILPAEENSGITFVRTDVQGFNPNIHANYMNVTNTMLGTTLANDEGTIVSTVEHLMAALWGCGVDNAIVELDAPEVPIMDGSSAPFVKLIDAAGIAAQTDVRQLLKVLKKVEVIDGDKYAFLEPSENFAVDLSIQYDNKIISHQSATFDVNTLNFKDDIASARTFGLEEEVKYMHSKGLGLGGSLDNAIIVGKDKILNDGGLRYQDEFVRHKILDCIGDFYLTGGLRLLGKVTGFRSGHGLNNHLLRALFADKSAWCLADSTHA